MSIPADEPRGDDEELDPLDALIERYRAGGEPALREFEAAHPELATEILELLPVIEMMEKAAARPVSPDEAEGLSPQTQQFGDYTILHEIGRGGMGVVYLAEQRSLGRKVALKILPRHALLEERHLQRFRHEARAAARLDHDHIVPVHEVGEQDGIHFYAMQFVDGIGLDAILSTLRREAEARVTTPSDSDDDLEFHDGDAEGGAPSTDAVVAGDILAAVLKRQRQGRGGRSGHRRAQWAAELMLQACDALAHAHDAGIIHRDVKPSNLLVDTAGKLWVADFGLAKSSEQAELTRSGEVVGTLLYMAPERFQGWSAPTSDVFALGLVLYELLTLERAFQGRDRPALMQEILERDPRPPHRIDPTIPADLETIVLSVIAKSPTERYPSAGAMASDLRAWIEGRPIAARRHGPWRRARLWIRRHPAPAALACVSVLALLTITAGTIRYNHRLGLALQDADRNYARARSAVRKLSEFGQTHLRDLPLSNEARKAFLEEALSFYEQLLSEGERREHLEDEAADAALQVANIRGLLGDPEGAIKALESCLSIYRRLQGQSWNGDRERALLLACGDLASAYRSRGRLDDARALLRDTLVRMEGLAKQRPEDRELWSGYAAALNNLSLLERQKDPATALKACDRAVEIQEAFRARYPEAQQILADLVTYLGNRAQVHLTMGKHDEATKDLESALAAIPPDAEIRSRRLESARAHAQSALARLHLENSRVEAAESAFRRGLSFCDSLVDHFPSIPEYRQRRASLCSDFAILIDGSGLGTSKRRGEAVALYERAISDQEFLCKTYPDVPDHALRLANSLSNLGRSHFLSQKADQLPKAEEAWKRAAQLLAEVPGHQAVIARASIHSSLGILYEGQKRPKEALEALDSAHASYERLCAETPERADLRGQFAGCLSNRGRLRQTLGRERLALQDYDAAAREITAALKKLPGSPDFRKFAFSIQWNRASLFLDRNDHESAAEAAELMIALPDPEGRGRPYIAKIIDHCIQLAGRDRDFDAEEREELIESYRELRKQLKAAAARDSSSSSGERGS